MLSEALDRIFREFPDASAGGDDVFNGHPTAQFIRNGARDAVLSVAMEVSPNPQTLLAKGSPGDVGRWTHTPWIAVMDRRETDTVQEGVYVVYLYATDCQSVFLTINQGCTTLFQSAPEKKEETASAELARRASAMRRRLPAPGRLRASQIDLKPTGWRSRLYEAGTVAAVKYDRDDLPDETVLRNDLREAMAAYNTLIAAATWVPDDELLEEGADVGLGSVVESKNYRQHRRIERAAGTAAKVKRVLGTTCMACDLDMENAYGPVAKGYIEAHHLRPLSSYTDNAVITLDPKRDFVVLCANCHRVIHRLDDASDLEHLRELLRLYGASLKGSGA